jgi:hypothetical protein
MNYLLMTLTEFNNKLKLKNLTIEETKQKADEFQLLINMDMADDYPHDTDHSKLYHIRECNGRHGVWFKYSVHGFVKNYIDERLRGLSKKELQEIKKICIKISDKFNHTFQKML